MPCSSEFDTVFYYNFLRNISLQQGKQMRRNESYMLDVSLEIRDTDDVLAPIFTEQARLEGKIPFRSQNTQKQLSRCEACFTLSASRQRIKNFALNVSFSFNETEDETTDKMKQEMQNIQRLNQILSETNEISNQQNSVNKKVQHDINGISMKEIYQITSFIFCVVYVILKDIKEMEVMNFSIFVIFVFPLQMKFGVFYASQTGNNEHLTNHICDQIKQVIQDAEFNKFHIEEIENKINKKEDVKFEVYDAYIIGSYVDCYQLPPYVPKFLDFIQKDIKDKPILTFLAHGGGAGCVGRQFNQILNKYQAKHMEHVEMKYCNNYAGLTYPKNKDEKQGINIQQFEQLDKNVKVFAQNLIDKKDQTPKFTKSSLFIKIFFKGFTSLFMKTMKQKIIIDQDKCIQCMKCCQICPQNCFEFNQETKQVQFINSDNCVGCRGCMQNCPQNAIDNKDGLMKKYVQYHFDEYQLIKDDKFHTIEELKQLHSQI